MIIVKLMGGLGNQMFQYALGRSLAIKHNVNLKLDLGFLNLRPENPTYTLRNYELDIFNIHAEIADKNEVETIKKRNPLFSDQLITWLNNKPVPYFREAEIHEKGFEFDPNILNVPRSCYLVGYWQSEKYFKTIEDTIICDFTIKHRPDELNAKLLEIIKIKNSVSIHFRRGDYISNEITNRFHGVCQIDYYHEAVKFISGKIVNPEFFIFSDDMDWVRINFKIDFPIHYIESNSTKNYEDLRLMTNCKHNILANSSFSWWGAWLNLNPGKIVIAPSKWFNESKFNIEDILPRKWIVLKPDLL